MKPYVLLNCFTIILIQNAFAQTNYLGNNFGSVSLSNSQGINSLTNNNNIAGNSAVSNSISIGNNNLPSNFGGLALNKVGLINDGPTNIVGNSAVSNTIGINNYGLASNNNNYGSVNLAGSNAAQPNLINLSNFSPNRNEQRLTNTLTGNSVVSNNIDIGNLIGGGVNTQNLGNTVSYNGNAVASNLAGSNVIASNFAANNVQLAGVGSNIGGVSLGGIEFVDASVANAYPEEMQVIGYVTFEGYLPVDGTVSVAGNGCDCSS